MNPLNNGNVQTTPIFPFKDLPMEVKYNILKDDNSAVLCALRLIDKELYIFATELIFNCSAKIDWQRKLIHCWSFNPKFISDKININSILRVIHNPNLKLQDRISGLILISSQNSIKLPTHKIAEHLISKLNELNAKAKHSVMEILKRLTPNLNEKQFTWLLENTLDEIYGTNQFYKDSVLEFLAPLDPDLMTVILKPIIDENKELTSEKCTIRHIALNSFTNLVPELAFDQLSRFVKPIICANDIKNTFVSELLYWLKRLSPKITTEQITSIFNLIEEELCREDRRNLQGPFEAVAVLAAALTPGQILRMIDIIKLKLANGNVDIRINVLNTLVSLAPMLSISQTSDVSKLVLEIVYQSEDEIIAAIKACRALIPKLTPQYALVYITSIIRLINSRNVSRFTYGEIIKFFSEVTPKLTTDEIPALLDFILEVLKNNNHDCNIAALKILMLSSPLFNPEQIAVVMPPLLIKLRCSNEVIHYSAKQTLKKISPKFSPDQIETILLKVHEHLNGVALLRLEAINALYDVLSHLTSEQITGILVQLIDRLNDGDLFVRNKACETLTALAPSLTSDHIFIILREIINTLTLDTNPASHIMALTIIKTLASKFSAEHVEKVLVPIINKFDSDFFLVRKCSTSALIAISSKLTPEQTTSILQPTLNKLYDEDHFVRLNAFRIFIALSSKLNPVQLGIILGPILGKLKDKDWNSRKEALKTLSQLAPAISKEQFSEILGHLIELLTDIYMPVSEEAMSFLSYLLVLRKCSYAQIKHYYGTKNSLNGMVIRAFSKWLNQMECLENEFE